MITDRLYRSLHAVPALQRQFRRAVAHLPHRERIVRYRGMRFHVDPSELSGFYLYYEHEYDEPVFEFLEPRLPSFRRALDIGANHGVYTALLARSVPEVDAFEPEPGVRARLQQNLELNRLSNVTVHPICVSNIHGSIRFAAPNAANEGVGRIDPKGREVPSTTLDHFLQPSWQGPLFIKMDIEGGEWLAFQSAKCLASGPRSILLEVHPQQIADFGGSVAELRMILQGLGFNVYALMGSRPESLDTHPDARFWWAEKAA